MVVVGAWATRDLVAADGRHGAAPAARVSRTAGPTVAAEGYSEREEQPSPVDPYAWPGAETPPSPEAPEHRVPAASPADDEARVLALLDNDAQSYAAAILSGDRATVRGLTAARCAARDPAQVIAARRIAIAAETGVAADQLAAGAPLTVHSDAVAGEAHAFLGLFAGGTRALTAAPDGWLLEGDHWRNAEC